MMIFLWTEDRYRSRTSFRIQPQIFLSTWLDRYQDLQVLLIHYKQPPDLLSQTWVIFDPENRVVIANTTGLSAGTSVNFIIRSITKTSSWDKTVYLLVVNCSVENWSVWQLRNPNSWQTCNSSYVLKQDSSSNYYWGQYVTFASSASTATQSAVGAIAGVTVLFSFWNMSNLQGIWITMNQFQLILLLLLTNSHIPKSIVDYLTGMKATTCSLNFVPFKDLPGLKILIAWLNFDLNYKNLESFGVFSGSTFVNIFSLIWAIFIIWVIHVIYMLVFKHLLKRYEERPKCIRFFNKIFQLFMFTIYIRLILEAYIFIILSSLSEIKMWNPQNTSKTISLIIAIICQLLCIGLLVLTFVHWLINRKLESIDHYMPLKTLFNELKHQSKARLYSTLLLLRRTFLSILLIMGSSINSLSLIIPMVVVQSAYLSFILIVRPWGWVKDNILEITNEVYYLALIALLAHFNSDDRWNEAAETVYFILIVTNSIIIVLIMLGMSALKSLVMLIETL